MTEAQESPRAIWHDCSTNKVPKTTIQNSIIHHCQTIYNSNKTNYPYKYCPYMFSINNMETRMLNYGLNNRRLLVKITLSW